MARPRSPRRVAGRIVGVLAATTMFAGCFTGERPHFSEAPTAPGADTGDEAIDAVLEHLDRASSDTFTAEYTILTKFGNREADARVEQRGPADRQITIGSVRFTITPRSQSTCNTDQDEDDCVDRVNDGFVSDLQVTHDFYGSMAARRLRTDAMRRAGASVASTQRFDGQPADCVAVTVSGGEKRYCALETGPLALMDGPDVRIELTSYTVRTER